MRQLFARFRYFTATLLFLLTTAMSSGGAVFAASQNNSATSPLAYTGQGFPISQQCQAGTDTPAGTMLFIFAYGGNYDPTNVSLHGITVLSQEEKGNETHIFTTYSGDVASLKQNVNVTWDGAVGNAQLVISHGCQGPTTTPVETQAPVVKTDDCGTANDIFTVPVVTGVVYKVGTTVVSGDVHTGGALSVTVTATPLDSTYTLTGTTSWTLNFTNTTCETPKTPVTPETPVVLQDKCGTDNDTFSVPVKTGVVYKVGTTVVNGTTSTNGALAVTVNAYPTSNEYTLTGTTQWTLNFTNVQCPCGCEYTVTPGTVTFHEACGIENDTYTIPTTAHVAYYVNGSQSAATPGVHHIGAAGTVTVEAVATDNYALSGTHTWSHEFTNVPCEQPPVNVTLCHATASRHNPYVEITVDEAGAYNGHYTQHTGAPFNGTQKSGDNWGDIIPTFTYNEHSYSLNYDAAGMLLLRNHCNLTVPPISVTATATVFTDACGTANDTYTIPATAGVVYKVNGVVKSAGTYSATGTVVVTAQALNEDYELTGTATWSHTFTNELCGGGSGGQVLGDSTVIFTPAATVQAAQLANTGQNSLTSAIVAFVIATSALLVYAFAPKRQLS